MTEWDQRFISLVQEIASWSRDPDEQVGALLVSPDHRQLSPGYNGQPRTLNFINLTKEEKNQLTIHAEVNAILNCPVDVSGWTLYTTKAICHECAKAIIQVDIYKVLQPKCPTSSSWKKSCDLGEQLLSTRGIPIEYY